jgi:hypothetical protein
MNDVPVRLHPSMNVFVFTQIDRITECHTTNITFVWFLAGMPPNMVLVMAKHVEGFRTVFTFIWLLACQFT